MVFSAPEPFHSPVEATDGSDSDVDETEADDDTFGGVDDDAAALLRPLHTRLDAIKACQVPRLPSFCAFMSY